MAKNWEEDAYAKIAKVNEVMRETLKEHEALFDGVVCYKMLKSECEEVIAIVSYVDGGLHVLWSDYEEELIEMYLNKLGDEAPEGTFIIKFWGHDEQTSYEYDEWDFATSENYEVEMLSEDHFEKALKQIPKLKEDIEQYKIENEKLKEELASYVVDNK